MKYLRAKLKNLTKAQGFLQGMVFAICFTSILSIAATSFSGFFVFSPGTPISSSEINANFEKLSGVTLLKAKVASAYAIDELDYGPTPTCPTCMSNTKKLIFDSLIVSESQFKTGIDADANSPTYGQTLTYFEVPSDGWYEIRLIGDIANEITSASCNVNGCNPSLNSNLGLQVSNSLSTLNTFSTISTFLSQSTHQRDADSNGSIEEINSYPGMAPEIKKVYLKAGQIVYGQFTSHISQINTIMTTNAGYPANSIEVTIIKH